MILFRSRLDIILRISRLQVTFSFYQYHRFSQTILFFSNTVYFIKLIKEIDGFGYTNILTNIFIHIQHKYLRSRIYSFTFNINIYVHKYIHSTTYAPVSTYSIRQNTIYIVNNLCIYKHLYTLKKTLYHL